MYVDKLGDTVDKYSNTYHITIKIKPADVKSSTFNDSSMRNNEKDPSFIIS